MITGLEEFVLEQYRRLSAKGPIFVAVSGGIDSVVLLHILERTIKDREILVLHINHNLRAQESEQDQIFVQNLAKKMGLKCKVFRLKWKNLKKTQSIFRHRRQAIFKKLQAQYPDCTIALAHNKNDQAETFLQRLMRGTGVRGLGSMHAYDGFLWRPLLGIERIEIQEFAKRRAISWREDSSNTSLKYERNWIRHELLPLMQSRRPGLVTRIGALADECQKLAPPNVTIAFEECELGKIYKIMDLRGISDPGLTAHFSFTRAELVRFKALLAKDEAEIQTKNKKFLISRGLLLWKSNKQSSKISNGGEIWQSVLGIWTAKGKPLTSPSRKNREKCRDALRRAKVPRFFADAIPALSQEEQAKLVPPFLGRSFRFNRHGVEYSPSPLAKRLWANEKQL